MRNQHIAAEACLHDELLQGVLHLHRLQVPQNRGARLRVGGSPLLRGQVVFRAKPTHPVGLRRQGRQFVEAFFPVAADEFIRVKPVGEIQHARRNAFRLQYIQTAQDGVLPRAVAIVGQVYHRRKAFEQLCLFARQRRAERRTDAGHAELRQRNDVHVPLDQHHTLQVPLFAQKICCVHAQTLVENGGVGRVKILRLHVLNCAPAKRQDVAVLVDDGENRAVAEHVKSAARARRAIRCRFLRVLDDNQPSHLQFFGGVALCLHRAG